MATTEMGLVVAARDVDVLPTPRDIDKDIVMATVSFVLVSRRAAPIIHSMREQRS